MVEIAKNNNGKTNGNSKAVCKPARMNFWKILLSGILFAIIAQIVHTIGAFLTMSYYTDANYFAIWSKLMMPSAAPPGWEFYAYAIGFSIITGILLSIVYVMVSCCFSGSAFKKGALYGVLLFLAAGIPSALSLYLLISLPLALIISWAIGGLVAYLIGGIIIAAINK
ncbi:MAG: hypothetical protein Q7J54_08050 [Candidatus Woesearchaeota archaeon]|nr:hypothetical protein [Candidatus Woesearchaeota archaeon]